MRKKWIWLGLIGIGIIIWGAIVWLNAGKGVMVRSVSVSKGLIKETIYANGRLEPVYTKEYFAPLSGMVKALHVQKGDAVKAGQVLWTIDMTEDEEQLQMERLNLQMIKAERDAASAQYQDQFKKQKWEDPDIEIKPLDLTSYDLRIQSSAIKIESLERRLSNALVMSEKDGIVTELAVKEGQMVAQGASMLTVSDLSGYIVRANVNELDAHLLERNMPAVVSVDAISQTYTGKVDFLAPTARLADSGAKDASVEMLVVLDERAVELRPGYAATVTLDIPDKPRLLVPIEAVILSGDKSYVFKLQEDQTAIKVEVTTGKEDGEQIEIVSGLAAGEQIIVEGVNLLSDGQKVVVE